MRERELAEFAAEWDAYALSARASTAQTRTMAQAA
jgi:hypothetical protein